MNFELLVFFLILYHIPCNVICRGFSSKKQKTNIITVEVNLMNRVKTKILAILLSTAVLIGMVIPVLADGSIAGG